MSFYIEVTILCILILLSAFTAMAETSLISLSKFKVRHWIEKKKKGAIFVKKLKDNPERLLSTVLITNNLVNTAAASITTAIAIDLLENNAIGIAIGVATFLILVFGDIIPKSIGSSNNELLSPILAPIVWYVS